MPESWFHPSSIPFDKLKAQDLEECVYWLLDAMGAKDLQWRIGGSGAGGTDQGRDIEATFYSPTADGEMEAQRWWIECKGRSKTVEPDAVRSAVLNAQGKSDLDFLIIASNTQFSNATRDWVTETQRSRPRPKIKLWDKAHLERYLSRHPGVVLRLFADALTLEGKLEAIESRFWSRAEYVAVSLREDIWDARADLKISPRCVFALIANEFANGNINARPWGAIVVGEDFLSVFLAGFIHLNFLASRTVAVRADPVPITRALAYLVLFCLKILPGEDVQNLILMAMSHDDNGMLPKHEPMNLLAPVFDQLSSEMQDVCTADCVRMHPYRRSALNRDDDELKNYWARLSSEGLKADGATTAIENLTAPCRVGFNLNEKILCPLYGIQADESNMVQYLNVIKYVSIKRRKST